MSEHPTSGADVAPDDDGPWPGSLHELAGELEQLQSLIRTVAWGVSRETDEIKATVADLAARLEDLTPPGEEQAAPAPPRAWVDSAATEEWEALAEWVDWLGRSYDLQVSRAVLPCWPAHLGVVEELAALHQAWRAAVTAAQSKTPNDTMTFWHDRWLHPCMTRLRQDFQISKCENTHTPPRPARPTDLQLLASAMVAAAERVATTGDLPVLLDPVTGEVL